MGYLDKSLKTAIVLFFYFVKKNIEFEKNFDILFLPVGICISFLLKKFDFLK